MDNTQEADVKRIARNMDGEFTTLDISRKMANAPDCYYINQILKGWQEVEKAGYAMGDWQLWKVTSS